MTSPQRVHSQESLLSHTKPSSSQIGRLRNIKYNSTNNSTNNLKRYDENYNVINESMKQPEIGFISTTDDNNSLSDDDDDESTLIDENNKQELAVVSRLIRIIREEEIIINNNTNNNINNKSINNNQIKRKIKTIESFSEGDVTCWLVNNDLLLIIATANSINTNNESCLITQQQNNNNDDDEADEHNVHNRDNDSMFIQAEADINLFDLAAIKGYSILEFENNINKLKILANELINNIDIKIENNEIRLVLNLTPIHPVPIDFITTANAANVAANINQNRTQKPSNDNLVTNSVLSDHDNDYGSDTEWYQGKSVDNLHISNEVAEQMIIGKSFIHLVVNYMF